jgi:type III secretion protein Q
VGVFGKFNKSIADVAGISTHIPSLRERPQAAERRDAPADTLFFEFAESPLPVRRLRRLTPETAAALRELFRHREQLVLEGDPPTTWRFALSPARSVSGIILDGAPERIPLSIADDGWCERLGEREWSDYSSDSRLLAWMLAHSALLEGLGRILREPLIPSSLSETVLPPGDARANVVLDFSAAAADGRVTKGAVSLSAAMVARLASHPGWERSTPTAPVWQRIPGTLRLELRRVPFRLAVLAASEIGDVLILGPRADRWRELYIALVGAHGDSRLHDWSACYDGARLTITPTVLTSAMELIMPEPQPVTAAPAGAADNIPVSLDFDLGSMALPLGELAALKPGYVFELPGNLEKLRVVIRANGTRIGYGELVVVGDVLGVQLLAIEVDGLR